MKTAIGGMGAAAIASACCIGLVAFSMIGAGALSASAVKLEPYRPWFIGLTAVLVGVAFHSAYVRTVTGGCDASACTPLSRRAARILAWVAATLAALLIAFPYYIGWFV